MKVDDVEISIGAMKSLLGIALEDFLKEFKEEYSEELATEESAEVIQLANESLELVKGSLQAFTDYLASILDNAAMEAIKELTKKGADR